MNPEKTALILVGYRNDYFRENGKVHGVFENPSATDTVLANTLAFISSLAEQGRRSSRRRSCSPPTTGPWPVPSASSTR